MEELAYISLKPSRIAHYLQVVITLLALLAIGCSGVVWWLKIMLSLLLVMASAWQWQRDKHWRVQGFACAGGKWRLWTTSGEQCADMVNEQLVLSWLVVMQWRERSSGASYAVALWPDSASSDELRRLRVFLRFGAAS